MSRGTNQKFKFTCLMKIMLAKTDDEHALTMSQIKDELEKYDVTAERKSIYADFPGGSGPINHFLEITFQMLQTFHVSKFKSVMVIDGIMIMHNGGCRRKSRKDVILKDSSKILFHVCTVEGEAFVAIKTKTSTGCIDEHDCVIPEKLVGSDAGSTDLLNKGSEFAGETLLKLA